MSGSSFIPRRKDKLEFEGGSAAEGLVKHPKRATCARKASVRSCTVHPKGRAPRQGAGCPREWAFEGVTGFPKGTKGRIGTPLSPLALAGEAARPQAMTFSIVCYNCKSLRGSTHLRWGQRGRGAFDFPLRPLWTLPNPLKTILRGGLPVPLPERPPPWGARRDF